MKKILTLSIAIASAAVLFIGCEGDDSDPSAIGTWKAATVELLPSDGGEKKSAAVNWEETLVLNEDGTYVATWDGSGSKGSESGTYTIDGNTLTLNGSSSRSVLIDGGAITITGTIPEGTYYLIFDEV